MNAIDRRDRAVLEFARDRFVRGEHEFLDELMRFIVLDPLETDRFAIFIDAALSLPESRDRANLRETFPAQKRRQSPRRVQPLA